jgi:LCP family protein required for cell wall assembly
MWFAKRNLKAQAEITEQQFFKELFSWNFFIIVAIVACLTFFGSYAWHHVVSLGNQAWKVLMKVTGNSFSTATEDTLGNINIVLAWYAGEDVMGWLLTDSMMIVSYNPNKNAATLLSVPRDLFVSYGTGMWAGKLNGMLWNHYLAHTGSVEQKTHHGAKMLMNKMSDISGIKAPYYALINFDGFISLIDSIGGISVEVPERLYDTEFPDDEYKGYITLDIPTGIQTMNGKTALRYARSRHSTSDFSRSERQQLIMKAVIDQIIAEFHITNIASFKTLFSQLSYVVQTNIDVGDMVGFLPGLAGERHMLNFVLSADCNNSYLETIQAGCILYNADRALFGGAATILPIGAWPGSVSYYKHTQAFGRWITDHQDIFIEKAPLTIINNIHKEYAKQWNYPYSGVAGKLAIELKEKGFVIDDVQGEVEASSGTTLYVLNPEEYKETIALLQTFVPIDTIITGSSSLYVDMTLSLGDRYLDHLIAAKNNKNP